MKFINFLGFHAVIAVLAVLAAPLLLVIKYPNTAEHISSVSKIMIPWLCIILLVFVFNNGIKALFASVVSAIDRLKRVGGTGAEFEGRQQDTEPLTKEQIQELSTYVKSVENERTAQQEWAWHFFFKYVNATIYGTQIKMLLDLQHRGKLSDELVTYYNMFLSRLPSATNYKFKSYREYLTSNILVVYDSVQELYQITNEGQQFLKAFNASGLTWDQVPG